ncbi:NAD(P)-dependent oxidoreductase [Paraburkholderia sp. DHOC27]|uniref:NAD(P)-dependent oxidoreductase n=1 Tax=Paraburkholderia sp. DHOC27 TaxID=2303330 RepID=UPI000E3E4117|nr:NAD(P)-dependent oxidoreductase [Paraburkholderia sp. DHOC27]RFU49140.1 NAD(P)-dependent oxidoreductase [Paraburkholderia sp. DHOC27]
MAKISMLGLGAMGSRMAANLIKAGHQVTVWNRSPQAVQALVDAGARSAPTPKEAAADADFVIAMVRDNDASRHVWLDPDTGALAGMSADTIAVDSSTLTAEWIRELGQHMAKRSISLLEAPVAGSTPQAEAAQLTYLVGGDADTFGRTEAVLKTMGSAIHHVGPLGSGALAKLATNTLLGTQVTVLAELIGMLKRSNADVARVLEVVATTPVWSAAAGRLTALMLSENFAPQFPVELIEKDFGYTVQTASSESSAPTIAAARSVFRTAMERGYSQENMTAVVKLFT